MAFNSRVSYMDAALGKSKADLVIKSGRLVNVYTSEIYQTDLAVKKDRIIFIGEISNLIGPETEVIDAQNKYLIPGFIDSHIHDIIQDKPVDMRKTADYK